MKVVAERAEDQNDEDPVEGSGQFSWRRSCTPRLRFWPVSWSKLSKKVLMPASILRDLETGFAAAAETLVTMRKAPQTFANARKDRGYGKLGDEGKGVGQRSSFPDQSSPEF